MTSPERIYLDNAATSWPKPPTVLEAIARYYGKLGVAAGRGTSSVAVEVDRTIETCRAAIAALIQCQPNHVAFCFNGTDGLNLAIHGLLRDGDEVVTTQLEHNSVLRPLNQLESAGRIKLKTVSAHDGVVDVDDMRAALTPEVRLCCINHASNVTGIVQPIGEIGAICQQQDTMLLVDAAQSVGHLPVTFPTLHCDIVVASGHKGLLGPLGTGFIALSSRAAKEIKPIRSGGTGTMSESLHQPLELPHRLESGNLNVGGIFGLLAGIENVTQRGLHSIADHDCQNRTRICEALSEIASVKIYGGQAAGLKTGVVSFNINGQDPQTVTALLDSAFGIQLRAGLHCAPLIHASIGSETFAGTIRVSPGTFTTPQQIDSFIDAIQQISTQLV